MIVNANISIHRSNTGEIKITIQDNDSRVILARVEMDAAQFTDALFGLAHVDVRCETGRLEHIGKVRVSEPRSVRSGISGYDKDKHIEWLKENCQEPGWFIDGYLGSQNSISFDKGEYPLLRYRAFKFVDKEPS